MALSTKLLLQTVQRAFKCLGRVDDWLLRSAFSEKVQSKALEYRNASAFQITATPH